MNNEIKIMVGDVEVTIKSASGKYAHIITNLIFAKGGKVVKEASDRDLERFVRPENRPAIIEAIKTTKAAVEASEEHKASVARQDGLDEIDAHQDRMARTMSVQG